MLVSWRREVPQTVISSIFFNHFIHVACGFFAFTFACFERSSRLDRQTLAFLNINGSMHCLWLVHQGLWQGCVPLHSILVIPRRVVAVPATFEILCIPMPYFRLCTSVKLNTRFVFESMYSRVWKQNVWVVLLSHIRFVCVWRATSSMFLHSEICLPRLWCAEWVHINVFSQEEIKEANFVGKLHGQVLWSYL